MCDAVEQVMAIPFYLPTDEQTEDDYRRLDQLLHNLYQVLRQILFRPGSVHQQHRNAGVARAPEAARRARRDLPDLVPGAPAAPSCPCARHRRRRRPCCAVPQAPARPPAPAPALDHWLVIGEQLRKIVDEFKSTKKPENPSERPGQGAEGTDAAQTQGLKLEVSSQGLFSLLLPHTLPSPIWTTVILLVGWRLLVVRSR